MPKVLSEAEQNEVINLMTEQDDGGNFIYGQREIERMTGLSRPFIRKLAKKIGHQFPRNGVEVKGQLCVCTNCGSFFRRPRSKVIRAEKNFCDETCKEAYMKGPSHPQWKHGNSASTFSKWVQNQSEYKDWREKVLARAGYQCEITGSKEQLDVHHILPKANHYDKAFDLDNGIVLSKPCHDRVHELIREGKDYHEAIEILKSEFNK